MVLFAIFWPLACPAQMSSDSYKINADSINAGGAASSSASFKLDDTVGEIATGEGASGTYKMKAGFQYMVNTYLTLAVDGNSEDLGPGLLIPGTPVTGQTIVSVTTDSWNGYQIEAHKDHLMRHADPVPEINISDHNGTIATPLLWQSPDNLGFGFSIINGTSVDHLKWGNSPDFKYAAFPGSATTTYVKEDYKSATDDTTFEYKTDVPESQKSGDYSCTVTYTAVGSI